MGNGGCLPGFPRHPYVFPQHRPINQRLSSGELIRIQLRRLFERSQSARSKIGSVGARMLVYQFFQCLAPAREVVQRDLVGSNVEHCIRYLCAGGIDCHQFLLVCQGGFCSLSARNRNSQPVLLIGCQRTVRIGFQEAFETGDRHGIVGLAKMIESDVRVSRTRNSLVQCNLGEQLLYQLHWNSEVKLLPPFR